eukprot:267844_1
MTSRNLSPQRRYHGCRLQDIPVSAFQHGYDEKCNASQPVNNTFRIQKSLQAHQARLIACNGDCGSSLAAIINDCVHPTKSTQLTPTQVAAKQVRNCKAISDALWLHNYPLRKELIDLMGKTECYNENDRFHQIYESLKNPSICISGESWRMQIMDELFPAFSTDHIDILNDLANKSCEKPDYSISQELAHGYERRFNFKIREKKLRDQIDVQGKDIALYATLFNDNHEQNVQLIRTLKLLTEQKKTSEKQLEDLMEDKKATVLNEAQYESKIEDVKEHPNYKEMQSKNMPLSNQEILAIIIFCEQKKVCREMRESQRKDLNLNSCHWKKLFHHLCCGLYKIWLILHNENEEFYSQYIANGSHGLLFRGIYGVHDLGSDKSHDKHTVTSFTSDFGVAFEFVANNGLILTIKNAYQAIYDGRLIAASVSWISKFETENEFILLPTTLSNIRRIDCTQLQQNDPYFGFIHNTRTVHIFEAMDYKSVDLKPVIWSVSKRRQPPTMWLGNKSPEYIASKKQSLTAWIILLGGFVTWQCPICNVKSRLCEYSGNLWDMSVECPSCRSLFLQFGDTNPDEFECYNLACVLEFGKIKHKDLEKVDDDIHGKGYRCRKCNARQRQAQFERYRNDAFLEEQATKYIDAVEKEFKNEINIRKDKDKVKEMILFVMNPDNNKAYIDEALVKFPVIWDWILQAPGVKESIDKNRNKIAKEVMKALGLPTYLAPVASGKMTEEINETISSAKKGINGTIKSVENMFKMWG